MRGFLAQLIANGTVTISGPSVDGGTATAVITLGPYQGPGLGRMLTATFPIVEGTDDNVTLTFRLRRLGNGLDYTYSRVGRIKRDRTGI